MTFLPARLIVVPALNTGAAALALSKLRRKSATAPAVASSTQGAPAEMLCGSTAVRVIQDRNVVRGKPAFALLQRRDRVALGGDAGHAEKKRATP